MNALEFNIPQGKIGRVNDTLVKGIRDYMKEHGFDKAVVGLSGGVDSAVTCVLAKEAAGAGNVLALSMPSLYSAGESGEYARLLAKNIGVELKTVPISGIYDSYVDALKEDLAIDEDEEVGVHLQNIQARIRGNILMAFSNRFGHLVLVTGNKSEAAVGYCTLYGDTAGGLAVISSLLKTWVYQLADYINRDGEVIPHQIIKRVPSAELKPGQTDQDTLPSYDVLDGILYYYLEEGFSEKELQGKGFESKTIKWVMEAMKRSEHKRIQSPPAIELDMKNFLKED